MHTMKPQTKIEAVNFLNAEMPKILAELNAILSPYIGKKIEKSHPYDRWIAKLAPEISALQDRLCSEKRIRAVFRWSANHVTLTIDTTVPSGAYSVDYVETYCTLCKLSGQALEAITAPEDFTLRADYTESEIAEKRAKIEALKAEISALEYQIPYQLRK